MTFRAPLKAVETAVGDWNVYYESVKAGPRGYFAVAKIGRVIPKPDVDGRFLALIAPGSFLPFDREVPRLMLGRPMEAALTKLDGSPKKGGAVQLAVRLLPEADFARIVNLGLPHELGQIEATLYDPRRDDVDEGAAIFEHPVLERLTRRPYRDVAFRRKVFEAYGYRCAISGLMLRNGGGRPKVQAAYILARGKPGQRPGAQRADVVGDAALDV